VSYFNFHKFTAGSGNRLIFTELTQIYVTSIADKRLALHFILRGITSLAWLEAGCAVTRLVAEKPVIESKHQLRPMPARQIFIISGELKAGGGGGA
jgi:hypothetical protein